MTIRMAELNREPEMKIATIGKVLRALRRVHSLAYWHPESQAWAIAEMEGIATVLRASGVEFVSPPTPVIGGLFNKSGSPDCLV